eukprot:gene9432-10419_t
MPILPFLKVTAVAPMPAYTDDENTVYFFDVLKIQAVDSENSENFQVAGCVNHGIDSNLLERFPHMKAYANADNSGEKALIASFL